MQTVSLAMLYTDDDWKYVCDIDWLEYINMFDEIVLVHVAKGGEIKERPGMTTGVRRYDYKWQDDFAAARNFAKSKCHSDWIMSLDPDEALICQRPLKDIVDGMKANVGVVGIQISSLCTKKEGAPDYVSAYLGRLYRNTPFIVWQGKIHESVVASALSMGYGKTNADPEELRIAHFGYHVPYEKIKEKAIRNLNLEFDEVLKSDLSDGLPFFYAARSCHALEMWEDASYLYQMALVLPSDLDDATKAEIKQAIEMIDKGLNKRGDL